MRIAWLTSLVLAHCLAICSAYADDSRDEDTDSDRELTLSAGAGVGTYADAASRMPMVDVRVAYWVTPELTFDLTGAVYPVLAPLLGPTYHVPLVNAGSWQHALLVGVNGGVLMRFAPGDGISASRDNQPDPLLGAQVGYGLQTSELDMRCTLLFARGLRNFASNDYFATLSLSVSKLIRTHTTLED